MGVRESQPQAPFAAPVPLAADQYSVIVSVLCPVRAFLARQEVARDPILIPIISESLGLTDGDGDPTGRYQYQSYYLYNHIYSHAHAAS